MQTALQTKPHRTIAANDNFNPLEAEFERHAKNPHVYELFKSTPPVILAGLSTTQLRRSATGSGGTRKSKPRAMSRSKCARTTAPTTGVSS